VLWFQCLGSQLDVSLEALHMHADGVPVWSTVTPLVCGHCSSTLVDPVSAPAPAPAPVLSPTPPSTLSLEELLLVPEDDSTYIL
jgi:hypothetical protein